MTAWGAELAAWWPTWVAAGGLALVVVAIVRFRG